MKMVLLALVCLFFCGCAADQPIKAHQDGIAFETGERKGVVMNVIRDILIDDGYAIHQIDEQTGMITCEPRVMLKGVLLEKTGEKEWRMQSRSSTFNQQVQVSARVDSQGVVELYTLVVHPGLDRSVDIQRSKKLAEYYEREIKKRLRLTGFKRK